MLLKYVLLKNIAGQIFCKTFTRQISKVEVSGRMGRWMSQILRLPLKWASNWVKSSYIFDFNVFDVVFLVPLRF